MSTQNDDTFTLPEFENRLWSELQQLHAELAVDDHGSSRRPSRGNPRRRYLTAVAGLAAAASIAAVALVVREGDSTGTAADGDPASTSMPSPAETGTTAPTPPPPDGSLDAPDAVQVTEWSKPNGLNGTTWRDEGSGRSHGVVRDAGGTVLYEDLRLFGLTPDNEMVDTAATVIDHARQEVYVSQSMPMDPLPVTDRVDDSIRLSVSQGWLVPDGREMVDGQEALRLVSGQGGIASPDPHVILWVEPATFRPLKTWGRETEVLNGTESTSVHTYVPRTEENLALLEMAVPDGYTRVERAPLMPM